MFGTPSTPAFGTPSSTPAFGTPSSTPAFGTPSTPSFATGFGSSLFSSPFSQQPQQPQQSSLFQPQQQSTGGGFNFSTPFSSTPAQSTPFGQQTVTPQQMQLPFGNAQLTTQMAPVAPLPFSLADRDIQVRFGTWRHCIEFKKYLKINLVFQVKLEQRLRAIVEAYKEEPGNIKYAFKHLLFSVTEPQIRTKPAGISDIMWAEAMGKLEGMESSNRERLWPQLAMGFKDLSLRLKLQDEVILSDAERLRMTQSNVKLLQRHFQAETLPRIERMRQQEQGLQRRLLRVMRIVEALEGKGFRLPLMKGEVELAEKLAAITRQLRGSGAELSRRVQNLRTISHLGGGSAQLPGSAKIHEQSLADMQEVLQQQTEAISRLANVLKRDTRDMEIIMAEDTQKSDD